jgi:hypothetical protein
MNLPNQLINRNWWLGNIVSKQLNGANTEDTAKPLDVTRRITTRQISLTTLDVPNSSVSNSAPCRKLIWRQAKALACCSKTKMWGGSSHDVQTIPNENKLSYRHWVRAWFQPKLL